MKVENQLDFVKRALEATPRDEWSAIAAAAQMSKRNLYNIVGNSVSPSYDKVYALLRVFAARSSAHKGAAK